ncbi:MAG: hypothetical protein ACYC5Q_16655 [Thermoleophilia bacterium]
MAMLWKFGFKLVGTKENGESVYVKDKRELDYGDAYLSFPFVDPGFEAANLLVIDEKWPGSLGQLPGVHR